MQRLLKIRSSQIKLRRAPERRSQPSAKGGVLWKFSRFRMRSLRVDRRQREHYAGVAIPGAGELTARLISATPFRLLSLPTLLLLWFAMFSLFDVGVVLWPFTPFASSVSFFGALQEGICHTMPVKLLTAKPCLAHFRHGLPVRSRARSPALMAP